jgi:hypothetical protein
VYIEHVHKSQEPTVETVAYAAGWLHGDLEALRAVPVGCAKVDRVDPAPTTTQ